MNEKTLLIVIMVIAGFWLTLGAIDWGLRLYRWHQHKKAVQEIIDTGRVPADYGVVKREQNRLNRIDEAATDPLHKDTADQRRAIADVRIAVAHIRFAGYVIGEQDHAAKIAFEIGVTQTPFKRGTGEAKQWVRGYCQGRNVLDIQQYYNEA